MTGPVVESSPNDSSTPLGGALRAVWVALVLIVAAMVGAAAGVLAFLGGEKVPQSVLTGGGAFGGAVVLMLALIRFVRPGN